MMKSLSKSEQYIYGYFYCKMEKGLTKFIGLDNKIVKFEEKDALSNTGTIFENSKIYLFENIKKEENLFLFIKNVSIAKKINGTFLTDDIKSFNSNDSYLFVGKIIKKEKTRILFLTQIDKLIILTNIGENFQGIDEYQHIFFLYATFLSKDREFIYFKMNNNSKIEKLNEIREENPINHKIAIKFNLLDFISKDRNKICKIGLELPKESQNIISNKTDKEIIFFIYDARNYNYAYFPQIVYLYESEEKFYKYKFFVYKSLLVEANIFIQRVCECCYEFLYFSLDNSLPSEIIIKCEDNKEKKFKEFYSFNSKIRKSIIFINLPFQNKEELDFGKNLLNIYLCDKEKTKLYGSFSLDTIKYMNISKYKYIDLVEARLKDIYKDYKNYIEVEENPEEFMKKYFLFEENEIKVFREAINEKFHLYNYQNDENTLNYFNSLCLWNFYYCIQKGEFMISLMNDYIKLYEYLIKIEDLDYVEKSMILVGFVARVLEDEDNLSCPKFFYINDLDKLNPYRLAYDFQFEIIENITENSCLFQPFLFLDSYIMDCKTLKSNFSFIKTKINKISAYSISMLPIEIIKKDLKKTIKNYFFVLEKQAEPNKRNYYASVQKYNRLITYNENILLVHLANKRMYNLKNIEYKNKPKSVKDYAFSINIENLHENFSHNKEELINFKSSPTLFFDRELNHSYVYHYETKEYGEAGKLVEKFIIDETLIDYLKLPFNKLGDLFEVGYFVDKDFNKLKKGLINIMESNEYKKRMEMPKLAQKINNETTNIDKFQSKLSNEKYKENEKKEITKEIKTTNKNEIKDDNKSNDDKDKEKIILSQYNTYILSADSLEELLEKVEEMDNKIFIVHKNPIENNTDTCNY